MSAGSSFAAPNIDTVPYSIAEQDAQGNPVALAAGSVIQMESSSANALVTPNPADPTGATGSISCPAGFVGSVNGTATLTNPDGTVANGSWTGTFSADEPASLIVSFGAPQAPAAAAAARKAAADSLKK